MKRKNLYLLAGAPGSGKSTWAKQESEKSNVIWCSRDAVRFSLLKDEDEYFSKEPQVMEIWLKQICDAIENENGPDNIIVDATHLTKKARDTVRQAVRSNRCREICVCFSPTLQTCFERNAQREGRARVPDQAISSMYSKFTIPNKIEGFQELRIIYD